MPGKFKSAVDNVDSTVTFSLLLGLQIELDPILVEGSEGRQSCKRVLLTFSRLHLSPPGIIESMKQPMN